jgi:hypothetical protein
MHTLRLCAILALFVPTLILAQDRMPMATNDMDKGVTANPISTPMPIAAIDNRKIVPLTDAEKAVVAVEMREMLASVQAITDGLARGDMAAVAEAASKSGMAMMQQVPAPIRMKFPAAFTQMGMTAHQAFDRIAEQAKTAKDPAPILKLLSEGMQNCVACHATYRFAQPQ